MKAIILAAGESKRLKPLTDNIPKALIEINGMTIFENLLKNFECTEVDECIVVVGFKKEKIIERFGSRFGRLKLIYIENSIYRTTNNIYSLWLARRYLEKGVVILEGDILFEKRIALRLLESDCAKSFWAGSKFATGMDGALLSADRADGKINSLRIAKKDAEGIIFSNPEIFKSAGILRLDPRFGLILSRQLDMDIDEGIVDCYYDLSIARCLTEGELYILDVTDLLWNEIDDEFDLQRAKKLWKR